MHMKTEIATHTHDIKYFSTLVQILKTVCYTNLVAGSGLIQLVCFGLWL